MPLSPWWPNQQYFRFFNSIVMKSLPELEHLWSLLKMQYGGRFEGHQATELEFVLSVYNPVLFIKLPLFEG
jgi:hypothetical protein